MRRLLALVLLLPVLALLPGRPAGAAPAPNAAEDQFFNLLNQYRTSEGVGTLQRDGALDGLARDWSGHMSANCPNLCHRPNLDVATEAIEPAWRGAAENVGYGGDVGGLHNAFVASYLHEQNMTGNYNRVGVGVVVVGERIWVTFDFLLGPPLPAAAPPAPPPQAPVVATGGPSHFSPATPQRLLDTRDGTGGRAALGGGTALSLPVAGVGQVPADAVSVVVNVTATNPRLDGFLTLYPCGGAVPTASNVNYVAGDSVPNLVTVGLGGGAMCVFSNATVDVVVDLAGWYRTGGGTLFTALTPQRVMDSRSGPQGQYFTVALGNHVAADAVAATMNLTVTEPTGNGFVTAYPCGSDPPLVSNVNFVAGQTVPNLTTVPIGANRSVCLFSNVPTHVIADLAGSFGNGGARLTPVVPQRLLDTRNGTGGRYGALDIGQTVELPVAGALGIPSGASAAILNVTVADTTTVGFVTVFPCAGTVPTVSNLNYVAGDVRANLVTVRVGAGGRVCFFTNGRTHLVADIAGYLA